MNRTTDIFLTG